MEMVLLPLICISLKEDASAIALLTSELNRDTQRIANTQAHDGTENFFFHCVTPATSFQGAWLSVTTLGEE